jgi:hypothetical protein
VRKFTKKEQAIIDQANEIRRIVNPRAWDSKNKRVARVDELVRDGWAYKTIVKVVAEEFDVDPRTVREDVKDAELARLPDQVEKALTLKQNAAMRWERRQRICEAKGNEADANYALDKWCRVMGAYAPKKFELTGSVSVGISVKISAIVGVLDADGLAALEIIRKQVQAAREAGLLTEAVAPFEETPNEGDGA